MSEDTTQKPGMNAATPSSRMSSGTAKGKKGLDYMCVKIAFFKIYRYLKLNNIITFAESNLLDLMIEATIGAQNETGAFYFNAPFQKAELAECLGYEVRYVNKLIQSLKDKKIITAKENRYGFILGFHPDTFGETVLVDFQQEKAIKKPARWDVDNSSKRVQKLTTVEPIKTQPGNTEDSNPVQSEPSPGPKRTHFKLEKGCNTSSYTSIHTSSILPEPAFEEFEILTPEQEAARKICRDFAKKYGGGPSHG